MRGYKPAILFIKKLGDVPLYTSAMTLFELTSFLGDKKEIEQSITVLPITSDVAKIAGSLFADLKKQGQEINSHDCLIAAQAIQAKKTLVSRNIKHFERISTLSVVSY